MACIYEVIDRAVSAEVRSCFHLSILLRLVRSPLHDRIHHHPSTSLSLQCFVVMQIVSMLRSKAAKARAFVRRKLLRRGGARGADGDPTGIKLTDLPSELVEHVAGFLDVRSLAALDRVNTQLHAASWNAHVFRAVALRGNGRPQPSDREWLALTALNASTPLDVWTNYLVADLRAARLESGAEQLWVANLPEVMQWLPQMLILHRKSRAPPRLIHRLVVNTHRTDPVIGALRILKLHERLASNPLGPTSRPIDPLLRVLRYEAVTFCYACRLLHGVRLPFTDALGGPVRPHHLAWPLNRPTGYPLLAIGHMFVSDRVHISRLHGLANQAAGALAAQFWHSREHGPAPSPSGAPLLPTAASIPFVDPAYTNAADLPRPFGAMPPGTFPRFHLPHMTSPTWLRDGAWTLMLWDDDVTSAAPGAVCRLPDAARLRLEAWVAPERPAVIVELRAPRAPTGRPGRSIQLTGCLCRRRGTARLVVRRFDAAGEVSVAACNVMVTPFGFVGSYTTETAAGGECSWIWMFKRAWSATEPPY